MSTPTGPETPETPAADQGPAHEGPAAIGPGSPAADKQWPEALYALAGVGDVVAEQIRKLVNNAPELSAQFQRNAASLPDDLRSLPREIRTFAADLPSYAAGLQSKARDLDGEAVKRNAAAAQTRAQDVYKTLVERGENAVNQEK
ncbi:hypothetical protein [Cryptosporangium phraense]|uniref:Uncharacterized protein n=1 Tax=Cryptosporangium phraense TaxID=2593070 RepID=A0A545AHE2_9ACTN|nr:hypothetical protein [Cryptosporangium phraense]TQS40744.1 hypothetical protein FL583_33445 [Cryptosporangium phraense]